MHSTQPTVAPQGESLCTARRRLLLAAAASCWTWPGGALARPAGAPSIPLALEAPPDLDPAGYLVSEKYDGVRAIWDGRELRFRSGLRVHAPGWFVARLPAMPLDGELWLGRGRFEELSGAVRRHQPSEDEWRAMRYMVFDLPAAAGGFAARARALDSLLGNRRAPGLQAVEQSSLPDRTALARRLQEVLLVGGEGLVLRRADAPYEGGRSAAMLKLKPLADAEATVLAHEAGQGRLAGRLGALRVRTDAGVQFKIGTGFSEAQRASPPARGERISFSYRGLTEDGVPRFASFLRVRPAGL